MADIFISYSQKDRAWVKRLVDVLTAEGWAVWWDLNIRSGETFDGAIERTLRGVHCVVAVWSEHSVDSDWVRAEAAWAKANNKLISTRIEDDLELPIQFYHVHTYSMVGWNGSRDATEFRKLVEDIQALAVPPSPASTQASDSKAPSAPNTESEMAPAVETRQEPSPASKAAPTPRSPIKTAPESSLQPTPKQPPSNLRRPGVLVGALVLGAVTLVAGIYVVTNGHFSPRGGPDEKTASRDAGEPAMPLTHGKLARGPGEHEAESVESAETSGAKQQVKPQTALAPLSVFTDTLNDGSEGPEMVVIPAGNFEMGCVSGKGCSDGELPVRTVTFEKPFAIGKYEVTFAEYDRFAEATGANKPDDTGWGRARRPVIYVNWDDARAYAAWLSEQTGKGYRLPSEAEWEYAAGAGTETRWSFGDDEQGLGKHAWYSGNADFKTHPVGEKAPNPWGLYDVHGNVWEWVQDCWHESYRGAAANGQAWEDSGGGDCGRRVMRGGSWYFKPERVRSAFRYGNFTGFANNDLGFRLAQDL